MDIIELFLESLGTLTLNKTRTGLAILGIVIGIGSVIALVSLGQATQQSIQSRIESLGSNLLTVQPGSTNQGAVRGVQGGRTTLTFDDAKAIEASTTITTISKVSPEFSRRTQITTGEVIRILKWWVQHLHTQKFIKSRLLREIITQRDVEVMNKVAVLGPKW